MPKKYVPIIPLHKNIKSYLETHKNIILVDGSNFIFYRVHALLAWWKLRYPETYERVKEAPHMEPEFMERFHKMCENALFEIFKKLSDKKTEPFEVLIAMDCSRADIWRMPFYPAYKDGRKTTVRIRPFFQYFYERVVPGTYHMVLSHPKLEADDCIAAFIEYLGAQGIIECGGSSDSRRDKKRVFVLSNDKDYFQLVKRFPCVSICNMKLQNLTENITKKTVDYLLFTKILNGDKSDNIPPVFGKSVGEKKVEEYIVQSEKFTEALEHNPKFHEQYELNRLLIDFEYIPIEYKQQFIHELFH